MEKNLHCGQEYQDILFGMMCNNDTSSVSPVHTSTRPPIMIMLLFSRFHWCNQNQRKWIGHHKAEHP